MDSAEAPWYNHAIVTIPTPYSVDVDACRTSTGLECLPAIFADHWEAFHHAHPRYHTAYYAGLVAKMLACGNRSCTSSLLLVRQRRYDQALESLATVAAARLKASAGSWALAA